MDLVGSLACISTEVFWQHFSLKCASRSSSFKYRIWWRLPGDIFLVAKYYTLSKATDPFFSLVCGPFARRALFLLFLCPTFFPLTSQHSKMNAIKGWVQNSTEAVNIRLGANTIASQLWENMNCCLFRHGNAWLRTIDADFHLL
jgi:hypothetical protein